MSEVAKTLERDQLSGDPAAAAARLAEEDPWVLQRLHHTFDQTGPESLEALLWLKRAIVSLRGRLSPSQRRKLSRAQSRAA